MFKITDKIGMTFADHKSIYEAGRAAWNNNRWGVDKCPYNFHTEIPKVHIWEAGRLEAECAEAAHLTPEDALKQITKIIESVPPH